MQINDNIIKVALKGIVKPDICLTAFGPATFTRNLNLNNGIYTLEFHSGTGTDKYSLDVSDDAINITPINTNFSSVKQPSIKKTPDNLIWAECYYNGSIPLCDTFAATSPKLEIQYLSEEVTDISECNGNTICMRKVAFFTNFNIMTRVISVVFCDSSHKCSNQVDKGP